MALKDYVKKAWIPVLGLDIVGFVMAALSYSLYWLVNAHFRDSETYPELNMGLWQVKWSFLSSSKTTKQMITDEGKDDGWLINCQILMSLSLVIEIIVIAFTVVIIIKGLKSVYKVLAVLIPVLTVAACLLGIVGVCLFLTDGSSFIEDALYEIYPSVESGWGYALFLTGQVIFLVSGLLAALVVLLEFYLLKFIFG